MVRQVVGAQRPWQVVKNGKRVESTWASEGAATDEVNRLNHLHGGRAAFAVRLRGAKRSPWRPPGDVPQHGMKCFVATDRQQVEILTWSDAHSDFLHAGVLTGCTWFAWMPVYFPDFPSEFLEPQDVET